MSTFLGNVLALALRETSTEHGGRLRFDLDAAADILAFVVREGDEHSASPMVPCPVDDETLAVLREVAESRSLTIPQLRSRLRIPHLFEARDEAAWKLRRLPKRKSYPAIGRALGLDHSSAIAAERRHARRLATLNPEPQVPAGTGGVPASPATSLPVPAELYGEPGQVSAQAKFSPERGDKPGE